MAWIGLIFKLIYKFQAKVFSGMLTWYHITKTILHRASLFQRPGWKTVRFKTHFELKGDALAQPGSDIVLTLFSCMNSEPSKTCFHSIRQVLPSIPRESISVWEFSEARLGRASGGAVGLSAIIALGLLQAASSPAFDLICSFLMNTDSPSWPHSDVMILYLV